MKATFTLVSESQAHRAIESIMFKMKFYEENRVATGGMMSDPVIMITYSGAITPSSYEFGQKNYYVEWPFGTTKFATYYSLLCPEGFYTDRIENFQDMLNKRLETNKFEVKQFKQ